MRIFMALVTVLISASSTTWAGNACSRLLVPQVRQLTELPLTSRWLGGDVGTSLRLPDGRHFWIFGDSFVEPTDGTRATSQFIHNSVALSKIDKSGAFRLTYSWMKTDHQPSAFFKNSDESTFDWPLSTFMAGDDLVVVLTRVGTDLSNSWGIKLVGTDVVRIPNWRSPIREWKQIRSRLSTSERIFPSAAAFTENNFVYLLANFNDSTGTHNGLARAPLTDFSRLEYLQKDGRYSSDDSDPKIVLEDGNTELSIEKVGEVYYAVQMRRNRLQNGRADEIIVQRARRLEGPWSAPESVYTPPETNPANPNFEPNAIAYAAKTHVGLPPARGLPFAVSYVVNTLDSKLVLTKPELYHPVFVP